MKAKWKQTGIRIILGTIMAASLCACSLSKEKVDGSASEGTQLNTSENENALLGNEVDFFFKEDVAIDIVAKEDVFSSNGRGVTVDGNVVTITGAGCYRLSGTMQKGQVIIAADKGTEVRLVLDNFEIHNDSGAAIYVENAGTVIVTVPEGTNNLLEQSGSDTGREELQDAALYSKDDLVIIGPGALEILGNYYHGIKAKDTLLLKECNLTVSAKEDAMNVNMDMLVESGEYTLTAGDDGVHTDMNLTISGGKINIQKSYEGLEGMQIWMEAGEVSIIASDDAINVASTTATKGLILNMNGGNLIIQAGGDGIDSNGSIYMTGGRVEISGPASGANGSLDCAGSCQVNGGIFTMAGTSAMAQTPGTDSTQVGVMVYFNETIENGTRVCLKDASGNEIVSMTPTVSYQCAYFSVPQLLTGETYTLWKDGTQLCEITMNSTINYYSSDGTERQGGFGGFGGGMHQGGFDGGMGPGGREQGGRKPEGMTPPEEMTPPDPI